MRRLPVYILIDTSGSMKGEPIQAVNNGLQLLISSLRKDPHALDTVFVSIITFDNKVENFLPLTELSGVQLNEISDPKGGTHFGEALEMLCNKLDNDIIVSTPEKKGDWMPLLFIMTDGKPSDLQKFNQMALIVKKRDFGNIIACGAGPLAKEEYLKRLTDHVYMLDNMDNATMMSFFKWVSSVVSQGSKSAGVSEEIALPAPPPEVNIVT